MTREGFDKQTERNVAVLLGASESHGTLVTAFTSEEVSNREKANPYQVRRFRQDVEKYLLARLITLASIEDLAYSKPDDQPESFAA